MTRFFRSKFPLLLIFLLVLGIATPLAITSIRSHTTHAHAVAPSTASHTRSKHFDSTLPDWPEFHGDSARDGNQGTNTILSKSNATSLVPVSSPAYTATGEAEDSPAIYQGILYYVANTIVSTSSTTTYVSTLYAIDTTTEQIVWSEPFPACGTNTQSAWVSSSPAVTTGLVNGVPTTELFIGWGSSRSSAHGCVYDINATTGGLIWSYPTSQVVSSPAIMSTNAGRIVVVGGISDDVLAFPVGYRGPLAGKGPLLWRYSNTTDTPPPDHAQYCEPAPHYCGDAVWSSPAEGIVSVNGTPHHYAYFGVGAQSNTVGRVDAIDMDNVVNNSPVLAWSFWDPNPKYDDDFGTVLTLTDASGNATRVYSGMNNGHMFGLDAATGAMDFDFDTSAHVGSNTQSMIHSTGALVTIGGTTELIFGSGCPSKSLCGGPFGYVWAIDALSTNSAGTLLWQSQNFGSDIVSSATVVNQDANAVVYILGPWKSSKAVSMRGDLLAIDPTTGALLADYPVFNHTYGALASPAIYGNQVFVTEGFSAYSTTHPGQGGIAAFQCVGC